MSAKRRRRRVGRKLINRSIVKVFDQSFQPQLIAESHRVFQFGWGVEVSDQMAAQDYLEGIKEIPGLKEAIKTWAFKSRRR
jgi:hypothetical protein